MAEDMPVEIVDYDPAWPVRFDTERQLLEPVLAPWLDGGIHHGGQHGRAVLSAARCPQLSGIGREAYAVPAYRRGHAYGRWMPMATSPVTGMSVDEWLTLPEDQRCELVEGEVVVSPTPSLDHQRVVVALLRVLDDFARAHGGEAFVAPLGVKLAEHTALEPDLLYVSTPDRYGPRIVEGPPDLVVEVSSPSTRRYDHVRKRELYERYGVDEYWFVDLEGERVEVHARGADGRYRAPVVVARDAELVSPTVGGLTVRVATILPG